MYAFDQTVAQYFLDYLTAAPSLLCRSVQKRAERNVRAHQVKILRNYKNHKNKNPKSHTRSNRLRYSTRHYLPPPLNSIPQADAIFLAHEL